MPFADRDVEVSKRLKMSGLAERHGRILVFSTISLVGVISWWLIKSYHEQRQDMMSSHWLGSKTPFSSVGNISILSLSCDSEHTLILPQGNI